MAKRNPADLIRALINQNNPSVTRFLTADNSTLGDPQVLTSDPNGDTSIVVTGVQGHGFKDQNTFKYTRQTLANMLAAASSDGTVANTGQSTVADMLASYNQVTGSILTIGELTNKATDQLVPLSGGYVGAVLTPVATHPVFKAGATMRYKGTFATLSIGASFTPDATGGTAYSSSVAINGGAAPYKNARIVTGSIPANMTLTVNGTNLVLAGTPAAGAKTYNFTVAVDSDDGQTASRDMLLRIDGGAITATFVDGVKGITLSLGGKKATQTDPATHFADGPVIRVSRGIAGNTPAVGSKRYFEVQVNQTAVGGNQNTFVIVGLCGQTAQATAAPGGFNNSMGWRPNGNMTIDGSTTVGSDLTYGVGSVLGFAVEYINATQIRVHISVNNQWSRGGVPGTQTGRVDVINVTTGGAVEFRAQTNSPNDAMTVRTDASEMSYAPPAGFTAGYL